MLEKGTSGLMSGEGKRAAASRPRTAPFLDSTRKSIYWSKWAKLLPVYVRRRILDQRSGSRFQPNVSRSHGDGSGPDQFSLLYAILRVHHPEAVAAGESGIITAYDHNTSGVSGTYRRR